MNRIVYFLELVPAMTQYGRRTARGAAALVLAMGSLLSAQPTVSYSEVNVNSLSSVVFDAAPDSARDNTGADVEITAVNGVHAALYGVFNTAYNIRQVTDSVYAKASLQSGSIKTKAQLAFGPNTSTGGAGAAPGTTNGNSSGFASFADSFRTYSGNRPFLWTSGTTATFHFDVTGLTSTTGTIPAPPGPNPPSPPQLRNTVYALLTVRVYKPGTIDLLRQLSESFSLPVAQQIEANLITRDYWYFAPLITYFAATEPSAKILPLSAGTPTPVDFTFTPNGDFDWVVALDTTVQLDGSQQNVAVTFDLSNSVGQTYTGPPGTTTYSGSGVFPATEPFTEIPPPPPTPGQALDALRAVVQGLDSKQGIVKSLSAKLASIEASIAIPDLGTACSQLKAFRNEVRAQTNKAISAAQAALLNEKAAVLADALGCGG